ncbi:hypothetical protein H0H87_002171 [Tephrocybe sp. NHM501043]|nr:hypothetical protein H0H87_002171 [Tephrocybe sp. NHM501043]
MRFSSFLVLASLAASSFATTVADVKKGLDNLSASAKDLDAKITAFPATTGTFSQAVNVSPVTDADANNVLDQAKTLPALLQSILDQLVVRKGDFKRLNVLSVAQKDASGLGTAIRAVGAAFISATPPKELAVAKDLKQKFDKILNDFEPKFFP